MTNNPIVRNYNVIGRGATFQEFIEGMSQSEAARHSRNGEMLAITEIPENPKVSKKQKMIFYYYWKSKTSHLKQATIIYQKPLFPLSRPHAEGSGYHGPRERKTIHERITIAGLESVVWEVSDEIEETTHMHLEEINTNQK